jgi:hypothetical protein
VGRRRSGSFPKALRHGDDHAIADLICDLGHLAEERGFDFLSKVKRGIGHWYAEHHASDRDYLGPDAAVEITITRDKQLRSSDSPNRRDAYSPAMKYKPLIESGGLKSARK